MIPYHAVIERPDGSTYVQMYREFEQLQNLLCSLGKGYYIVEIF